MSEPPPPQQLFLPCDPDPVFVTVHRPAGAGRDTAAILIPPFGWDEICCYRSLRSWADQFAQDGYPTLRLSLPATGDSGGDPRDADRLAAWTAAVAGAADWLRASVGARRVVAVGIGMGGLVACVAAAAGAGIDDLALWATPARGRTLLRQLRAFSKLERSQFYEDVGPPPPAPDGELEAGGFVLTAATLAALEAVDLTRLELPAADGRRALLLERDGLPVDSALRERLEQTGVAVTVVPGEGFADMTSHPQTAQPPVAVIERLLGWLRAASPGVGHDAGPAAGSPGAGHDAGPAAGSPGAGHDAGPAAGSPGAGHDAGPAAGSPGAGHDAGPGAAAAASIHVRGEAQPVRETALVIPAPGARLSAILAEPATPRGDGLCAVLLNAGAVRRVGPSRMWVEASRRWAAQGTPVLRLDLEAIGDADGDETPYREDGAFYAPGFVPQVVAALDFLQERRVGDRFVLGGLCSGAFWSFHAALEDQRVSAVALLNPRALIWTAGLGPGRDLRAFLRQPFSVSKIRRLATGPRLRAFLRWVAGTPLRLLRRLGTRESESAVADRQLDVALDGLVSSGKDVLLLFSAHEPLHRELVSTGHLARLAAAANVTVKDVPVRDHTMRPGWAQQEVHRALDRVLARQRDQMAALNPPQAG